jgi:ribosome-associated toxin RatA of RatAB toxin-antitoxin module
MKAWHIGAGALALVLFSGKSKKTTTAAKEYKAEFKFTVGKVEELKSDKGVTVSYDDKSDELIAEATIKASADEVSYLLWKMEDYPKWMPRVKQVNKLSPPTDTKRLDWLAFEVPGDTLSVISEAKKSERDGVITISFKEKKGVKYAAPFKTTNINLREGRWVIEPIDDHSCEVSYYLHSDAGGDMAPRLLRNLAAKGIIETFAAIEKKL